MEIKNVKNFDLKDALKAGADPDQMLKDFKRQLAEAQQEIVDEQEGEETVLEDCRSVLADSFINYLVALGILPTESFYDSEMKNELMEVFKEVEDTLIAFKPLADLAKKLETKQEKETCFWKGINSDAVIRRFLSTL